MGARSDGVTPSPLFLPPLPPASCKLPLKFTKERDIKRSRFPRKGRGENSEVKKRKKKNNRRNRGTHRPAGKLVVSGRGRGGEGRSVEGFKKLEGKSCWGGSVNREGGWGRGESAIFSCHSHRDSAGLGHSVSVSF